MAVLRAFQAADMRAELGFGIPVTLSRFEIVLKDAVRTTSFRGDFAFPFFDTVDAPWQVSDDPFLDPRFLPAVEGVLLGYEQARLGLTSYEVQGLNADAFAPFFALFRLDDTQLFQSLVFAGSDTFFGSRQADLLIGYAGADRLWGFDGADFLRGGRGSDSLYGLDGRDGLAGGPGRDWLWGGEDDDALLGGAGGDFLRGEDGDDDLAGDRGADALRGGDGADSFRYFAISDSRPGSDRRDTIADFRHGADLIDLARIDADAEQSGRQPFDFIGENPFTDTPGQLRFDPGDRLVQGDTDGDGRADFEIALGGSAVPVAGDFLL